MDSLTQATLGAAVGHLCWNKNIGSKALLLGAVGGTIPDLDIILYPVLDDIQRLYWHRGESHSIFFIFFGALVSAWVLGRLYKPKRLPFTLAFLGALLIYATHILIDLFTVYGTQLLAPVSRNGFALGNFFIIDPLFTLPIFLGCLIAAKSKTGLGWRANLTGLSVAICYTLWSFSAQNTAHSAFQEAIVKENQTILRQRTTAGPFTTFLWRHVAETETGFLVAYWSIFDGQDRSIEFYTIPRSPELVENLIDTDTFTVLQWFSQGWWFATEDGVKGVRVVDLRFGAIPSAVDQTHRDWSWPFSWRFDTDTAQSRTLYPVVPEVDSPRNTLELLAIRISGGENWYSKAIK